MIQAVIGRTVFNVWGQIKNTLDPQLPIMILFIYLTQHFLSLFHISTGKEEFVLSGLTVPNGIITSPGSNNLTLPNILWYTYTWHSYAPNIILTLISSSVAP